MYSLRSQTAGVNKAFNFLEAGSYDGHLKHFPYLETYQLRKRRKTKEERGAQTVVTSHTRLIPSPPCTHSLNTFQVSRYGN